MNHLRGLGQYWPKCIPLAMSSYNPFCGPNVNGFSPYELVFGRKPKALVDVETDPYVKISETHKKYYELLKKGL